MSMKENKLVEVQEPTESKKAFSNNISRAIEERIKPLLRQPVKETLRKPKADKGV